MNPPTSIAKATRWYPVFVAVSGLLAALFIYLTETEFVGHIIALAGLAVAVAGFSVFVAMQRVTPKHGKWDVAAA